MDNFGIFFLLIASVIHMILSAANSLVEMSEFQMRKQYGRATLTFILTAFFVIIQGVVLYHWFTLVH